MAGTSFVMSLFFASPLPGRPLLTAVAEPMLGSGLMLKALAVVTLFESYLRLNELLALLGFQVLAPVGGTHSTTSVGICLRTAELRVSSKTRFRDGTLLPHLPMQQFRGRLRLLRKKLHDQAGRVFAMMADQLRRRSLQDVGGVKVVGLLPTLHSLTRGSASHDRTEMLASAVLRQLQGLEEKGPASFEKRCERLLHSRGFACAKCSCTSSRARAACHRQWQRMASLSSMWTLPSTHRSTFLMTASSSCWRAGSLPARSPACGLARLATASAGRGEENRSPVGAACRHNFAVPVFRKGSRTLRSQVMSRLFA